MKLRKPDYYDSFACIADRCQDTCCAGWEIEVDEEAMERYEKAPGAFGEHLRSMIGHEGDETYFILQPGKRCPFLNQNNLCEMILQLGEDWICDICREHPRFYQWYGNYTEVGLGLCCEEAGRLLFSRKDPAMFVEEETVEEAEEADPITEYLIQTRDELLTIARDRSKTFRERIAGVLARSLEIQTELDGEETAVLSGTFDAAVILEIFGELESLDGSWNELLRGMKSNLQGLLAKLPEYYEMLGERMMEYEHLLVYFLSRYYMEADADENVLAPVRFAAAALIVITLLDVNTWITRGSFSMEDRIQNAKLFSKEIEYCPENMEALSEDCMTEPVFGCLEEFWK